MPLAVKQKRSSRRTRAASDDGNTSEANQPSVLKPYRLPGVETASGHEARTAERPAEPDLLLTKLGTPIALASLIFDADWYRHEYPDVAAVSIDPVEHYFDNGSREGRNPNRYFDTNWYASNNPDVAAAGLNPFMHYLLYGAREGRRPAP